MGQDHLVNGICLVGKLESNKLVKRHSQRPDIMIISIQLFQQHFRTGIERCTVLRLVVACAGERGDVEVGDLKSGIYEFFVILLVARLLVFEIEEDVR